MCIETCPPKKAFFQMVDVAFDEKRRTAAMMQKVSEVVVNNANAAHIIDKIVPQNGHSQPNYDDLKQVAHPEGT